MKNQKSALITFFIYLIILIPVSSFCQDFIRLGVAHNFKKESIIQTFSFDFNRTEKVDEKKGRFLLYSRTNFYISPTTDLNIGDGVTSSENNILFQIYMGKAFFGRLHKANGNLTTFAWNKAIEINPSFNSDKSFEEKLFYGQLKLLANFISSSHSDATSNAYIKSAFSFSPGIFTNLGYRNSKTFNTGHLYSTIGMLTDLKYRLLNKINGDIFDNWIFGLSGNYYYIAGEVAQLTPEKYAGSLKASIDKRFYKNVYLGLVYKYNTDNPTYSIVHTLELSLKVKY